MSLDLKRASKSFTLHLSNSLNISDPEDIEVIQLKEYAYNHSYVFNYVNYVTSSLDTVIINQRQPSEFKTHHSHSIKFQDSDILYTPPAICNLYIAVATGKILTIFNPVTNFQCKYSFKEQISHLSFSKKFNILYIACTEAIYQLTIPAHPKLLNRITHNSSSVKTSLIINNPISKYTEVPHKDYRYELEQLSMAHLIPCTITSHRKHKIYAIDSNPEPSFLVLEKQSDKPGIVTKSYKKEGTIIKEQEQYHSCSSTSFIPITSSLILSYDLTQRDSISQFRPRQEIETSLHSIRSIIPPPHLIPSTTELFEKSEFVIQDIIQVGPCFQSDSPSILLTVQLKQELNDNSSENNHFLYVLNADTLEAELLLHKPIEDLSKPKGLHYNLSTNNISYISRSLCFKHFCFSPLSSLLLNPAAMQLEL